MGTEATIVLLTKNAGEQFREVLNAVFDQSGDYEVLVIDSGSTDATLSIAQEFPVRLIEIEPESFGHGRTRNLGAVNAKGDYICYLTQDATPRESWLENLLQPMKEDDTIAGVYSRQLPRDGATPMKKHFLKEFYPPSSETRSFSDEELIPLDDTFFSNVASGIRADVLEEIPFPEDPIMSEDQIWAKRALEAGYKIRYEPTSKVRHSHREGIVDIFKRYFDSGASLKHLNDGRTSPDVTTNGLRYVIREVKYLIQNDSMRWFPYSLAYNGAKFVGYQFGRHSSMLPEWVKIRLSDSLSTKYSV